MSTDRYTSPLSERYASKEMQYIFSQDMKFKTWRRLWIALAETEMELGLSENGKPVITQEQIDELKAHVDDINYDVAREREKLVRHDVMSHVYAYGQQCPKAAGIIHLGATSCYVGDNTDIIVMNEALKLVHKKLVNVINELAKFADKYKNLPTLAFTHFQPAQPTTVGKRATLWTQEFIMDLEDLEYVMGSLKLLGSKGTTGTQASFLELFNGDQETIDKIDPTIAAKMGFKECYAVSGQTYSRKVDTRVANILAGIAASAHKMSNDIRLLQHLKEVEEPFEKNQIGSSAMAYKRNPMRSERIASLSRYVMVDALNPAITSATQWFERTLDDSANKRLSIAEGFLACDGVLDLCLNVVDGLVVYPGETISVSEAIGPTTAENGYYPAGSYENGTTVETYGGGICQVSTTLYNAVIRAELEIVTRAAHSMIVSYVEPSMDAAIADGIKDLQFKNNQETPIYIEGYTSGGIIYFNIYGKETR